MSKASEKKKRAREKAIAKARNLTRGGAKRGPSRAAPSV